MVFSNRKIKMGKVISFSGVDGSGKTTQVNYLGDYLINKNFKIFKTRVFSYLIYSRINQLAKNTLLIKRKTGNTKLRNELLRSRVAKYPSVSSSAHLSSRQAARYSRANKIFQHIWFFFALIDHWLYYLFVILPKKAKYDYVICDRYFFDMFINSCYQGLVHPNLRKIYASIIPGADLYIYLRIKPVDAKLRSKDDFPLGYYKTQTDLYNRYFKFQHNVITLDAQERIVELKRKVLRVINTKKILYIVSGIGPYNAGGVTAIYELIKKISIQGAKVEIITPVYFYSGKDWYSWAKNEDKIYGISFHHVDAPEWIKRNFTLYHYVAQLQIILKLFSLAFTKKYDIVHEFVSVPFLTIRSRIFSWVNGAKHVVTISTYYSGKLGSLKILSLIKSDLLVVPTESLRKETLKHHFSKREVLKIPFGIDVNQFRKKNKNKARENLGLFTKGLVVLYTGPINEDKGAYQYAQAVEELARKHKKVQFLFISSRERDSKDYISRRKKILDIISGKNNIKFKEGIFDISDVYKSSDIVVVPQQSPHGTMMPPVTIIEAMAAGCCVIGTNTEGITDILKDGVNGYTYNKDERKKLEIIISKLIKNNSLRSKVGIEAQKAVSQMTISNTADNYLRSYSKILQV